MICNGERISAIISADYRPPFENKITVVHDGFKYPSEDLSFEYEGNSLDIVFKAFFAGVKAQEQKQKRAKMGRTYNKRIGIINKDRTEPIVEIYGTAVMTKDGIPAIYDDHVVEYGDIKDTYITIPEDFEVVKIGNNDET